MLETTGRGDGMHAPQGAAHDQEVVEVVEFRSVAALARVQGKAEALVMEEAVSLFIDNWRDDRQLVFCEFVTEAVFFDNLFITPASRAVKFDNQRVAVLYADLVDPVFVTVQGKNPAVAQISTSFDGIHDEAGRQRFKWVLAW